ncbi:hypothetical protein CWI36_0135p0030 [Hamiltosporidium magnivora]|uniref:Uncharacterized protein n=1 Tax=Hamiltosporidium magnivora TaxID=148818 RepID=A0A4Q9LJT7_9MICR|nr:hypothetical protein CWI36_0135p0030 [Hamiltosporidium magnivora]
MKHKIRPLINKIHSFNSSKTPAHGILSSKPINTTTCTTRLNFIQPEETFTFQIRGNNGSTGPTKKKRVDLPEETIPTAHATLLQIQEKECMYKIHQGTSDYSFPTNKIPDKRYKCTYHKSNNHTDQECIAQQERKRDIKRKDINHSKQSMMVIEKEYPVKNMEFIARINNTTFDNILLRNSTFLKKTGILPIRLNNTKTISVANGETHQILEKVEFPLQFKLHPTITFKVDALVLPSMPTSVILGIDFLNKHNSEISFKEKYLTIRSVKLPLNLDAPSLNIGLDQMLIDKDLP